MSSDVKVDITDLKRLEKKLDELPAELPKFLKNVMQNMSTVLLQRIQEKAPKDTGAYAASWKVESVEVKKTRATGTISTPQGLLYTILEFTGRAPGEIRGKTKPLAFPINGQTIIVWAVFHPGFNEEPHVRPAINEFMDKDAKPIIFGQLQKFSIFSKSRRGR